MKLKKFFGHLNTVNKHRFLVFKYCVKAGIPFRGLVHDLSKYSLLEFLEGVKYYKSRQSKLELRKDVDNNFFIIDEKNNIYSYLIKNITLISLLASS